MGKAIREAQFRISQVEFVELVHGVFFPFGSQTQERRDPSQTMSIAPFRRANQEMTGFRVEFAHVFPFWATRGE